MNDERLQHEVFKALAADYEASAERALPVLVKDIAGRSPVTLLEEYLLMWPPRDVRFEPAYLENHRFDSMDDPYMVDVADGMLLNTIERDPQKNAIVVGVYFQDNLGEFERFNLNAARHNREWEAQGSPEDVFDPRTGDVHKLQETYVPYATPESPYRHVVPWETPRKGKLFAARPRVERGLYAKIRFTLEVLDDEFVLSFVAYDYGDKVIFFNEIRNPNLAYLTRRAVHELFGNPFVAGSEGPLLNGIAYLIQGKKLKWCHEHHTRPTWLETQAPMKSYNPELAVHKSAALFLSIGGALFAYILPILIFWNGIIVNTWEGLKAFGGEGENPWYLHKLVGSVVLIVLSSLIAKFLKRQGNVARLTSNLV